MDCPQCHALARCVDSRHMVGGFKRRRYACACGLRFSTAEVIAATGNDVGGLKLKKFLDMLIEKGINQAFRGDGLMR